ncbi:MAG: hypothetical protein GXZ05_09845 [Gammaproteobacteria bacterium]|nr:hypothetical protein [Gammaproteobacteria bacterium]
MIPIKYTLSDVVEKAIKPAYALLPVSMRSREATAMLLAIGLQESAFKYRRQIKGPARGFWQFEAAGGFRGVLQHRSTERHAAALLVERGHGGMIEREQFDLLEHDDVLAAGMARLLLWTDPKALPALNRPDDAFEYYLRTWRPGAYTRGATEQRTEIRARWNRAYGEAMQYA